MFGSDNQAPAHPRVLEAMLAANEGRCGSYGDDPWTVRALDLLYGVFETRDLDAYFVGTGGAANGLALSALCPPWAAILAHPHAHVLEDEGNGPEFFTSGSRLVALGSTGLLVQPKDVEAAAVRHSPDFVHGLQPRAVTLTNLSETGQTYSPDHLRAISAVCKKQGWALHVDGARFANAVVGAGASAAELSWAAGVDALSFGLTKNGAVAAEILILFGTSRTQAAAYLRKRAGQLFSKHRFLSAQAVAMLEGDLWLELAGHANQMAHDLGAGFERAGASLAAPVMGNEVFIRLDPSKVSALQAAGVSFYPWATLGGDVYRFVASWQTTTESVDTVARALA
jgi:threonine aldolase